MFFKYFLYLKNIFSVLLYFFIFICQHILIFVLYLYYACHANIFVQILVVYYFQNV